MNVTCSKLYADIPFAHRQPSHLGHCRFCHGHNWSFLFKFSAREYDECGFIVDFGKLLPLKQKLLELDHALVLNVDDPFLETFKTLDDQFNSPGGTKLAHIVVMADCSCEGLARWALLEGSAIVEQLTKGRATVKCVTCYEDSKNSATAEKEL